jgi:hypothetical protein
VGDGTAQFVGDGTSNVSPIASFAYVYEMKFRSGPEDGADDRTLVSYRSPDGEHVTSVRSTLIASSLTTLRELGHYDRYLELLPDEHRERILLSLAPEWLPIEVGQAHYSTCDALDLPSAEMERIGELVSARIMGTFLGTLVRAGGRNVGATPWIPLAKYDVLWSRLMQGGSCLVERAGPKDVVIHSHGASLFDTRYFRVAYNGVVRGAIGMFATRVIGRTTRSQAGPYSVTTAMSWV